MTHWVEYRCDGCGKVGLEETWMFVTVQTPIGKNIGIEGALLELCEACSAPVKRIAISKLRTPPQEPR